MTTPLEELEQMLYKLNPVTFNGKLTPQHLEAKAAILKWISEGIDIELPKGVDETCARLVKEEIRKRLGVV